MLVIDDTGTLKVVSQLAVSDTLTVVDTATLISNAVLSVNDTLELSETGLLISEAVLATDDFLVITDTGTLTVFIEPLSATYISTVYPRLLVTVPPSMILIVETPKRSFISLAEI